MLCECAWCKRMKVNSVWLSPTPFKIDPSKVTHGICPSCRIKFLGDTEPHELTPILKKLFSA